MSGCSYFKFLNSQGNKEDADFLAATVSASAHIWFWRFVVFFSGNYILVIILCELRETIFLWAIY